MRESQVILKFHFKPTYLCYTPAHFSSVGHYENILHNNTLTIQWFSKQSCIGRSYCRGEQLQHISLHISLHSYLSSLALETLQDHSFPHLLWKENS